MNKTHNNISVSSECFRFFPERGHVETEQGCFRLGPVNMAVLTLLIEQQGQVVSRRALFDSVWKNQIVSDDVLTRSISDIRSQLSKYSKIKLIETLPKRGYRWLPDVSILKQDSEELKQAQTDSSQLVSSFVQVIEPEPKSEPEPESDPEQTALADSSQSELLATKPLPSKRLLSKKENQNESQSETKNLPWLSLLKNLSLAIVTLFFIATSSLWLVDRMVQNHMVRVALIPIQGEGEKLSSLSLEIDDILRSQFSQIEDVHFLARSAVSNRPQNAFKYFSREFATQWIIEGHVRVYQNKLRISLSLVDAHTATVSYELIEELENNPNALEQHCQAFIEQTLSIILPAE
jgi:DNA-binding winged helix-turn-helix (wHTH) protein